MQETQIVRRWREVQYIHDYLSRAQRNGSMENALNRVGGRFITRNDFVISVMDEFGIGAPSIKIEKHLRILYSSFHGSDVQKVDCCAILCTYLSVVYKETIQINPNKVFNCFCDVYSPENNNDSIPVQDVLNILSIGCVNEIEFDQCSEKVMSSIQVFNTKFKSNRWNHAFISREKLNHILDCTPLIMIQFRERILKNLDSEKQLALLDLNENKSVSKFRSSEERLVMRRVVLIWNCILYKSFDAWTQYTKEESLGRLLEMRMQFWKARRIICFWRSRAIVCLKLSKFLVTVDEKFRERKQRNAFNKWLEYTRMARKIQKACLLRSDSYKSIALGMTLLRIVRTSMQKKILFRVWRNEIWIQLKFELAHSFSQEMIIKRYLRVWYCNSYQLKLKRKEAEHKRWAMSTIQGIKDSIEKDITIKHVEAQPKKDTSRSKVISIREKYTNDFDKNVLKAQREARRIRYENEKNALIFQWKVEWDETEKKMVHQTFKQTQHWLSTKGAQNDILKYVKSIEMELKTVPPIASDPLSICLSILDGQLAQLGILTDYFFEDMLKESNSSGLISQDSFVSYLDRIDIRLTASQVRDVFNLTLDEDNEVDKQKGNFVKVSTIREKMRSTYNYMGVEGSKYKKYVNPCHAMLVFHDIASNKMVLEYQMTKKKMKIVAFDHFLANSVVKTRRELYHDKKKDLKRKMQHFSAAKIQAKWRAMKQLSKTKLQVKLHKKEELD